MITEQALRADLAADAAAIHLPPDFASEAIRRGRRKRTIRRIAGAGGAIATATAVTAIAATLISTTPRSDTVSVPGNGPAPSAAPWWKSWPTGRHVGPLDPAFSAAARPRYDGETQPERIRIFAGGTTSDGTDWLFYTDESHPHTAQYLQGWDGRPDFGEAVEAAPHATWMWQASPTRAAHDTTATSEWLFLVGRPGTTRIDYAADGIHFIAVPTHQGLGVLRLDNGLPPSTARVRLADATGRYADALLSPASGVTPTRSP